jgi:hypothetical protein
MTRISNNAANTQLVNYLMRSQQRINQSQVQLSTDKVSQNYAGIARESERLVGLENTTTMLERYSRNNELMDLRLKLTETAMGGIEDTISEFRSALLDFSNLDMTDEKEVAGMQDAAYRSLRSLEAHLNTDVNGEFLFAGSRSNTQPVDFDVDSLAVLQDKWNGDTITYPTYYDNNVHPKITASTGSPDDPANTGFGRLTFAGGLGGTITSDQAGYQTDTITLAGTVQDGDQYTVTIDGTPVVYTVTGAEADLAAIRTNIISAINANPTVSALVTATSGTADGDLIITNNTPSTAFTTSVTASNLPAIAQIDTVTITGTPEVGDQYTITVDGNPIVYTVDGTEGGTLAGLRTAITAKLNTSAAGVVTATDSAVAGEIYLTAVSSNTAFTTTTGAVDIGPVAQVETITISTGLSEAGDVFTTTVGGVAYPYTTVGPEDQDTIATGLAALINAGPLNAAAVGAVVTVTAPIAGTPYTSASTVVTDFNTDGNALTATDAVTQANIVGIADNTATVATTQLPEAGIQPAIAQVDNVTLSGTYAVSDTIAIDIDSLGAETYTVTANDLTANGDGTGGAATTVQARTNIAASIVAAIADNPTLAAVATPTSVAGAVVLTAVNAGTTFTTSSTVTDVTTSGGLQSSTISTPTANFEGGIPAVAQVDTLQVGARGTDEAGDAYAITINGLTETFTTVGGEATPEAIALGIKAQIEGGSSGMDALVTITTDGSGLLTFTAKTANTTLDYTTTPPLLTDAGAADAAILPAVTNTVAAAAAIITNTDNAATLVSVTAGQSPFSNIPVGTKITITDATNSVNNTTFTVAANTGSIITVAATETVVSSSGYDLSSALTMTTDISYYNGDEVARTHQVSKVREFTMNTTAIDPAFEKAVRAMFIVAQGDFGTDGGLDNNQDRIDDALYLVRSALDPNVGGTPPYGTENGRNLEQVETDIAYQRILIDQTNANNRDLITFLDTSVSEVENIDQLAVITRLLDDQQSLEASYQSMARIRQLSLVNFL